MEPDAAGWGMKRNGRIVPFVVALCLVVSCSGKKESLRPPPTRVDVIEVRLAANREFVALRFRVIGGDRFDPEGAEIYLVDESTGERFSVVRLQRIGRMAEFRVPGEKDVHHVMFRNQEGKLRIGSRVTLVIGPERREHLLVQP
jgi:hypothetical protein